MTKKEALRTVLNEVEAHIIGLEDDPEYAEVMEAIAVLYKSLRKDTK